MKEIVNDLLGYEGVKIIQRPDMFNFSIDSTLIADFVTINRTTKKIIDFGCGNAPIPIFLSLKTKAKIIGIEIQPEVFDLAKRSVELNKLQSQIEVIMGDINNVGEILPKCEADIVVCNPPFFKYTQDSNINKNNYKTIARHEVLIDLEGIIVNAKKVLKTKGNLCLVHRASRLTEIISLLEKHNFALKRLRFVYPKINKEAFMILVEAKNNGNAGVSVLEPLYVYKDEGRTDYSEEVLRIFNYGRDKHE